MRGIRKFILILFTYFYIFNPTNFSSFNFYYVLIFVSVLYSILNFQDFKNVFLRSEFVLFIFFHFYLIIYIIFVSSMNEGNSEYRVYTIFLLLFLLPCSFYIIREYSKLYFYRIDSLLRFLDIVVFFQLAIVFLSLFVPELRLAILETSRDPELLKISTEYGLRSFGLANGYTSTFPMFMGLIAIFHMYYFAFEKKVSSSLYHLIIVICLTVAVILNARVGLIPIFLFFSCAMFLNKLNRPILKLLLLIFAALFVFFAGSSFEVDKYIERLNWAFEEINDLIDGEATGTFSALQNMVVFPLSFSGVMFGLGIDIFGENSIYDFSSDIGPIKDIFIFGFLNLFLYSIVLFLFFKKSINGIKRRFGICVAATCIISIVSFYIKGAIFAGSEIVNLLLIVAMFYSFRIGIADNEKISISRC